MTEKLAKITLLALDVDGTLTDGGIFLDTDGGETKQFHAHDGLGIVLARHVGLKTVLITGRRSPIVQKRAEELGIPTHLVLHGVRDKAKALAAVADATNTSLEAIAYVGDDLNDVPAMALAGVALCPADATPHIRGLVDVVLTKNGGQGAVREAIERILLARNDYERAVRLYLETLAAGQ